MDLIEKCFASFLKQKKKSLKVCSHWRAPQRIIIQSYSLQQFHPKVSVIQYKLKKTHPHLHTALQEKRHVAWFCLTVAQTNPLFYPACYGDCSYSSEGGCVSVYARTVAQLCPSNRHRPAAVTPTESREVREPSHYASILWNIAFSRICFRVKLHMQTNNTCSGAITSVTSTWIGKFSSICHTFLISTIQ